MLIKYNIDLKFLNGKGVSFIVVDSINGFHECLD